MENPLEHSDRVTTHKEAVLGTLTRVFGIEPTPDGLQVLNDPEACREGARYLLGAVQPETDAESDEVLQDFTTTLALIDIADHIERYGICFSDTLDMLATEQVRTLEEAWSQDKQSRVINAVSFAMSHEARRVMVAMQQPGNWEAVDAVMRREPVPLAPGHEPASEQ